MAHKLIIHAHSSLIKAYKQVSGMDPVKWGIHIAFKRPYLDELFEFCLEHFRVGVWTSMKESLAREILRNILPKTSYQRLEFIRGSKEVKIKTKNLKQLKLENQDVLLVDDNPRKLTENPSSSYYIIKYYKNIQCYDDELLKLKNYLEKRYNTEEDSNPLLVD